MQKKIIALAVAGLVSGAAFAQSNVTIYGVADATFDNVKATGATTGGTDLNSRNRITSNSSFIGFKGTEDLGGGLKAVWQFENGLNTENGAAGAWNNRDSFVGLSGGFGTVVMGNVTGPTRALGGKMDVNAGYTGIGANSALLGKLGGGAGASAFDQRIENAIAYISPNFSGFSGVVGYSAGTTAAASTSPTLTPRESSAASGTAQGNVAWTLGLNYETGPIFAGYAYTKVDANNVTAAAGGVGDFKNNRLAAKYSAAGWSVGLMWDKTNASFTDVSLKRSAWFLPVTFNVTGNGKIIAQYGKAGDVKGGTGNNDTGASMFALGYEHSMSKRTVLKAVWSQISNKANANYDYMYGNGARANSSASNVGSVSDGADPKGFSVGIRHSF